LSEGDARLYKVIDECLHETSEEEMESGGAEDVSDLTSTQISRLKKLALLEKETSGLKSGESGSGVVDASVPEPQLERGVLPKEVCDHTTFTISSATLNIVYIFCQMPEPRWPEVSNWVTSIKLLRPICELSVDQSSPPVLPSAAAESEGALLPPALLPGADPIDPALWYCHTLNRLQLRLAPGSLTSVHPEGLSRLSSLSPLILSGNSLSWSANTFLFF